MTKQRRAPPPSPVLAFIVVLASGGCSVVPEQSMAADRPASRSAAAYPGIDPELGEYWHADEQAITAELSDVIEQSIRTRYAAQTALRDAHPKAHGCVKAEVRISDALPESLAKGAFVPGKTYQAWIRFSNGSADAKRPDTKGDARGMAIKLLDVPGPRLAPDGTAVGTQDFILINHPVFFANDPAGYLAFMRSVTSDGFLSKLKVPFALGSKGTLIALRISRKKIANPVEARYWSMVPYQLGLGSGRQAVKYSARPCSAGSSRVPVDAGPDFLRAALRSTLNEGDACMSLLVQPRTSDRMEVEDSMTEWREEQAPFHQLATIHIPRQVFDTPQQNAFCENLSFDPWHSLAAHKPLGVTNRMRKVIYERISQVRHEMNQVEVKEP